MSRYGQARSTDMPYWSVYCVLCGGYITDALLECVPAQKRSIPAYRLLFLNRPGAALACAYCGGLIGFDDDGQLMQAEASWRSSVTGERS